MATVWSYRVGAWTRNPGTGWSHTIAMSGLADLVDSMERFKLLGTVTHLAIVAHGDSPGTVGLEHPLTSSSIPHFAAAFERLKGFLASDAWVTFYSCIAGKDEPGSRLLSEISRRLPERTMVGSGFSASSFPSAR